MIDFDLDAGDQRLKEVFKRLNRTFYSLSIIERIATEYSSSEFLLTARALCGDIPSPDAQADEIAANDVLAEGLAPEDVAAADAPPNAFMRDPGVSAEKWAWLQERARGPFTRLLIERDVFSAYEFQRKTPLMFVLNVMATVSGGYYTRNDRVKSYLDDYNAEYPESDRMIDTLNMVAASISGLQLEPRSIWFNKANFFTMVCELATDEHLATLNSEATTLQLQEFEANPTREYQIAAREGVNNRPERILRAEVFRRLLRHDEI